MAAQAAERDALRVVPRAGRRGAGGCHGRLATPSSLLATFIFAPKKLNSPIVLVGSHTYTYKIRMCQNRLRTDEIMSGNGNAI